MRTDETYGHAHLTIVSVTTGTADAHIPGVREGSISPFRASARIDSGTTFSAERLTMQQFFPHSQYERRGWTMQEKLLSRRCLYLTHHQAIFQCREGFIAETARTLPSWASARLIRLNSFLGDRPVKKTLDPFHDHDDMPNNILDDCWCLLQTYSELVSSYTARHLSFPADAINAFSGITAALEKRWSTKFIQGLPLAIFDVVIFWAPTGPLTKRLVREQVLFPSWSWAGWEGPVSYLKDELQNRHQIQPSINNLTVLTSSTCYSISRASGPIQKGWLSGQQRRAMSLLL